jgi:predicted dinucleotide-utilizing enzyme
LREALCPEKKIDLKSLKEPHDLRGHCRRGGQGISANVNVAATLCLAAREGEVKVRIIADPKIKVNRHEIVAGDFGEISTKVENAPSPRTPRPAIWHALCNRHPQVHSRASEDRDLKQKFL